MKNLLLIITLLIYTVGISQDTNTEDYIIDEQTTDKNNSIEENPTINNSIGENIPNKKQNLKAELRAEKKQKKQADKLLQKRAEQRAISIQKELSLTNHTSYKLLQSILKYSKKATKVIQSNASQKEKSKALTNIVYFQNEELKGYLTVLEFYKYLEITGM